MKRGEDPFAMLGLPTRPGLTDDDVRAAWRRIATATHPDRADGGDPERFAAAAAAYTALRTPSGRGEALADLPSPAGRARRRPPPALGLPACLAGLRAPGTRTAGLAARVRRGRPARLLLRAAAAGAACALTALIARTQPATPALIVGAITWLVLTARRDLAPPEPRPGPPRQD